MNKVLRIVHASLEVFDSNDQARSDLEKIKQLRPHLLGGTESGGHSRKAVIHSVLERDYFVYTPPGDGWGAIRLTLLERSKRLRTSFERVLPSGRASGDRHRFMGKNIVSMSFDHSSLGHIGWVPGAHYLTGGRHPSQQEPGDPVNHIKANARLAGVFTDTMLEHAAGSGIAFGSADTNLPLRTMEQTAVGSRPITSCWSEVGRFPNTGHGNIDAVFSVNSDGRVRCTRAEVLTDKDLPLHMDHFVVYTEYRVTKLNNS